MGVGGVSGWSHTLEGEVDKLTVSTDTTVCPLMIWLPDDLEVSDEQLIRHPLSWINDS